MIDAAQAGLGLVGSTVFILVLFIGFCVTFGFLKTRRRRHGLVVQSLDEASTHRPVVYLSATIPHGPIDQLKAPELIEARARKD